MTYRLNILSGCVMLTVVGCATPDPAAMSDVGSPAPPFRLINVADHSTVTSDSLKGDVVVLSFWSTSCTLCIQEIQELKAIQAAGEAQVVGIAIDDDDQQVNSVVASQQINYPVLHGNEKVFTTYDGFSIPYTLVLDQNLRIRKKIYGRFDKAEIDALLESLEQDPGPEVLSYRKSN